MDFARAGIKISVNDLIIKAVGTALQHVPQLNLNTVGEDDVKVIDEATKHVLPIFIPSKLNKKRIIFYFVILIIPKSNNLVFFR